MLKKKHLDLSLYICWVKPWFVNYFESDIMEIIQAESDIMEIIQEDESCWNCQIEYGIHISTHIILLKGESHSNLAYLHQP